MIHWLEIKSDEGEKGILIKEGYSRILSVVKKQKGIQFMEECDNNYSHIYTKEEALKLVDELRDWIIRD